MVSLDTTLLVAMLTVEAHSDRARGLVGSVGIWRVSDWAAAEFSAAIRVKARRGELVADLVPSLDSGLEAFIDQADAAFPVIEKDHRDARGLIVRDGRLRAPDALHIVAARRIGAALATFDVNQVRAAQAAGLDVIVP